MVGIQQVEDDCPQEYAVLVRLAHLQEALAAQLGIVLLQDGQLAAVHVARGVSHGAGWDMWPGGWVMVQPGSCGQGSESWCSLGRVAMGVSHGAAWVVWQGSESCMVQPGSCGQGSESWCSLGRVARGVRHGAAWVM